MVSYKLNKKCKKFLEWWSRGIKWHAFKAIVSIGRCEWVSINLFVHNSMVKLSGGIPKIVVLSNFLKILMVSDKTIHKAFRSHTAL